MKNTCIWCQNKEPKAKFLNQAHIFPKSLGGKRICKSVCDSCNAYFGSKQPQTPSVEIALKEPLNISRLFLLSQLNKKNLPKFKSEYFTYDISKQIVKPKFKYRLISDFQTNFTRQFKRGIYKIYLEERENFIGDALNERFNFIREFARFGIGDCPVFYCKPKFSAIFLAEEDLHDPIIRFTNHSEEIMQEYGFYNYYFLTHLLIFPIINHYEITIDNYMRHFINTEGSIYKEVIPIKYITDLEFLFSYAF